MFQENPFSNFHNAASLVAGQGFRPADNTSGKTIIAKSALTDQRLHKLCEIYTNDPSDIRRSMAERTIRKEYPGSSGPNGDISLEASIVLEDYQQ